MRKITKPLFYGITLSIIFLVLTTSVNAQEKLTQENKKFTQSINTCPGGWLMGIYSVNYEYLYEQKHGFIARFDLEDISEKFDGDNIEATGLGFIFNYRWHISEAMESYYVGSYTRVRLYDGSGDSNSDNFDFEMSEFTIGINAGKRWVWDNGININFMLGYGVSYSNKELGSNTTAAMENLVDKFEDEYDFTGPFLGELSIGYAL